jgi:hypothetical protein
MVFVRREIFASKFRHVLEAEIARRVANKINEPVEVHLVPWWRRATQMLINPRLSTIPEATHSSENSATRERERDREKSRISSRVRPEMIRRMDDAPKLINPSGYISEGHTPEVSVHNVSRTPSAQRRDELGPVPSEGIAESALEEAERDVVQQLETDSGSEDSLDRAK